MDHRSNEIRELDLISWLLLLLAGRSALHAGILAINWARDALTALRCAKSQNRDTDRLPLRQDPHSSGLLETGSPSVSALPPCTSLVPVSRCGHGSPRTVIETPVFLRKE